MPYGFYTYLNEYPTGRASRKPQVGRPPRNRKKIAAGRKAARRNQ